LWCCSSCGFLSTIKLSLVCLVFKNILDFDWCHVYHINRISQLLQLPTQESIFLGCGPTYFTHKCMINAQCNEQCIIAQCQFGQIETKLYYELSCCVSWKKYSWDQESKYILGPTLMNQLIKFEFPLLCCMANWGLIFNPNLKICLKTFW